MPVSHRSTTAVGADTLDDGNLLRSLVKSAKSSHSKLGRALDTNFSCQRYGGAEMEPSALTTNRREKERQLQLQKSMQSGYADSLGGMAAATTTSNTTGVGAASMLVVPQLATMTPSLTAAADDGAESLGGIRIGNADRGYITLIGAVPTSESTQLIENNYELISSFRAYQYDAHRATRQAAMRDISAPHPDLLQQLNPVLASARYAELVDVDTLPYELRKRCEDRLAAMMAPMMEEDVAEGNGPVAKQADGTQQEMGKTPEGTAGRTAAVEGLHVGTLGGTYPFVCQGRPGEPRRLAGNRHPCVGQYHMQYKVVEPRVVGGYVQPRVVPPVQRSRAETMTDGAETGYFDETGRAGTLAGGFGHDADGDDMSVRCPSNLRDVVKRTGSAHRDTSGKVTRPGESNLGTSMFVSGVARQMKLGTAAPDATYWPYPDVRSTTKRITCPVKFETTHTQRRRDPPVSGVPTGAYNIDGDYLRRLPWSTSMERTTGRSSHWHGRMPPPTGGEYLDVDEALKATRPNPSSALLPPRTAAPSLRNRPLPDTSVSVERNLDYPKSSFGDPAHLTNVRSFANVTSRAERDAREMRLAIAGRGGMSTGERVGFDEDEAADLTEPHSRMPAIHPLAPGHQPINPTATTDIGNIPSLACTRPRAQCTTDLGKGSARPVHLLPIRDLMYDAEKGYKLIGPRVKGAPYIGSTFTRRKREELSTTAIGGCGAKVTYDVVDFPKRKVQSVPDFEKQITKETEFRGHLIQSERYKRLFPTAPGPGYYNVNFSQVE